LSSGCWKEGSEREKKVEVHGVCFRGGGREGEDGGLKCKTIAMRGLKVLLNIGGWWAKRLTFLIGSLIKCSVNWTSSQNRTIRATKPPQFYSDRLITLLTL